MIEALLITSRETLEAGLVVSVLLSFIKREHKKFQSMIWYGVAAGLLASVMFAIGFVVLAGEFSGRSEKLFEGITMLLAGILLTTMIVWMMHKQNHARALQHKVSQTMTEGTSTLKTKWNLFLFTFFAILREGVETVIFLAAIGMASGSDSWGAFIGVLAALVASYLVYKGTYKLPLKQFFKVTSILLLFFAAGLMAHGIHELEEAEVLSGIIYPVWDINPAVLADGSYPLLHEKGAIGSFLAGLFGYNGNPSLLEVIVYLSYWIAMISVYFKMRAADNLKPTVD